MWSKYVDETLSIFGCAISQHLLILLSVMIILSPINPSKAAQEFDVFRAHQYDFQNNRIGNFPDH